MQDCSISHKPVLEHPFSLRGAVYHVEALDTKQAQLVNRPENNRLVALNSLSSQRSI